MVLFCFHVYNGAPLSNALSRVLSRLLASSFKPETVVSFYCLNCVNMKSQGRLLNPLGVGPEAKAITGLEEQALANEAPNDQLTTQTPPKEMPESQPCPMLCAEHFFRPFV